MSVQEQDDHMFDEQTDLMSLAIGSDLLIKDTESITEAIDVVYDELRDFSRQYEPFVQIYNENVRMTADDFRSKDHDFMNHTILKIQAQTEEIEKMDVRASIKIVRLDGEKMKRRIRESPKQGWNMLKEFIPKF